MSSELLSFGTSAACLLIVLFGLRRTRASLLNRLAACFATIMVLNVVRWILISALGNSSDVVAVADISLSFISNVVLITAGIELVHAEDVSSTLRDIVGLSFPTTLLSHAASYAHIHFDKALAVAKAVDSATSAGASAFVGLAILVRLFVAGEWLLGAITAAGYIFWTYPEALYWQGGDMVSSLLMCLGGFIVALTAVAAADRRVI